MTGPVDPAAPPGLAALAAHCPGTLAVAVRELGADGRVRRAYGVHEDAELPLASVGKLLILAEAARGIEDGRLDPCEPIDLHEEDHCAGSGLLRHLSARRWTLADLAVLTAAVSDNTATNALLRRLGRDRVNATAAALGLTRTRVLDRIREPRLPGHPPTFARGTARELADLAVRVATEDGWPRRLRDWMLTTTDHGLAAALVRHDPEGGWLAAKTGVDAGIRADVGVMAGRLAYAVLACGPAGREDDLARAVRQAGRLAAEHAGLCGGPAG